MPGVRLKLGVQLMAEPTSTIRGTLLRHDERTGNFVFEFICPLCFRTHRSSAPELSAPSLCHGCMNGWRKGKAPVRVRRTGGKVIDAD